MANENNLIGCIIETKNPAIVRMMKLRGCQYAENNGFIQFAEEPKDKILNKTYCDYIKMKINGTCPLRLTKDIFKNIEGLQVWKTSTGWEHLFTADITIYDKKNPKKIVLKTTATGIGVFSEIQNHYYGMFQVNNYPQKFFYFERWFDDNGNLIKAEPKSKMQTNRIYMV